MNVTVSYSVMQGGLFGGLPAFFIRPDDSGVAIDLVDFEELKAQYNMHQVRIVIDIITSKFRTDLETTKGLIESISKLVTEKYIIIGYITADEFPAWAGSCSYLIQNIMPGANHSVLGFQSNEVRWQANSEDLNYEPAAARTNIRLLELGNRISLQDAYTFLGSCEQTWGLVLPPKKHVEVDLT